MTELSALVYLVEHVKLDTLQRHPSLEPMNEHSRSIDIAFDEHGDIILHNVVHAIALALDAEDAHLVFTVVRGCKDDIDWGGGGHDGLESGSMKLVGRRVADKMRTR